MDSTSLKAQIDTDITNKTGASSISKLNVGGNIKSVVDYVDQEAKGYKIYSIMLSFNGSTFTVKPLKTDFGVVVFTPSTPSNGLIYITADTAIFTVDKSIPESGAISNGGVAYFNIGKRVTDTIFKFDLIKFDGTQTATPTFSDMPINIRVYN